MLSRNPAAGVFAVVSVGVLFAAAVPAPAQLMSKWGHPVFTFGATPYDSINAGHGNYPGGPGFIPGYGNYPGPGPDHYPWMDGPDTPFDRRRIAPPFPGPLSGPAVPVAPVKEAPPLPGTALIIVKVPAEAELFFDGARTAQGGSYRRFVTPSLPKDGDLSYTIRARWLIKDADLSRVEEVRVRPGQNYTVNFLTVGSWTGSRLETLPPPSRMQEAGAANAGPSRLDATTGTK